MSKKVLVTGASGFLGSHISEAAHDAGYEVHALIRPKSSRRWLSHSWLNIHVAEFADRPALFLILKDMDAVIHNAGALWGRYHKVNTDNTKIMAEEAIKAGTKRFIYVSSMAAGGPCKGPYSKDGTEPDNPISPYGISKKDAEEFLKDLRDQTHVVILRYPMIYGPRDTQTLRLFKNLKRPVSVKVGFKPIYISTVYVKDAARAAVRALQADVSSGSLYEISDGAGYTFDKIYEFVGERLGSKSLKVPLPFFLVMFGAWLLYDVLGQRSAFNPDQIAMFREKFWLVSPERAISELGWRPQVNIHDGVRETIEWYRQEGWL